MKQLSVVELIAELEQMQDKSRPTYTASAYTIVRRVTVINYDSGARTFEYSEAHETKEHGS